MKQLTIVASKKDREMQNLLAGEIVESNSDIKVVSMDEKEYDDTKSKLTTANKIILLGNSKIMKSYENIVHYKVNDKFGFRYGWLANVAIIDIDEKKVDLENIDEIVAEIHRFSGIEQNSDSNMHEDSTESSIGEGENIENNQKKVKQWLNATRDLGGVGETIAIAALANPLKAVSILTSPLTAVSSAAYIGAIGTSKYNSKKKLIRDMKVALIKRFVLDKETGLNSFLNN
ncbi:hypothetical protein [Levilactobacillus namurensis]|uniref:Uncharacterized protein n=1 Tax=Levilactobacillus namurensis TaxID=380393 RepID=A0AAW8W4P7_9LACO|nr:hypothetical protein [Levilactobacillus namurensis]MDT7013717.1 hypothetical protein [Levilactobacillus namurensis]